MAKDNIIRKISGMNDIIPDDNAPYYVRSKNWQYVYKLFTKQASDYGYEFIETPEVEKIELFKRTVGKSSDIVRKEMYVWEQGDEILALRPEGSAATCRAVLESNILNRKSMLKVWYKGGMFRRERPQQGRYRRHTQFGIEFFGVQGAVADAEVISFLYKFYQNCGLNDLEIHLNSVGCPTCRNAYKQLLVDRITPKLDDYCEDCKERLKINPMRILDCKVDSCRKASEGLPSILDHLCDDCKTHFEDLKHILDGMGISYVIDSNLVRGLDYYSKTAFEVLLKKAVGPIKTLSGGGRYDGLSELLGGDMIPAVGCGIGIERLLLAMERNGEIQDDSNRMEYYIAYTNVDFKEKAFNLMTTLRDKGHSALMDYKGIKMKKQLSQAQNLNVKYAIILADEEYANGCLLVKDMDNSTQVQISIDEFLSNI